MEKVCFSAGIVLLFLSLSFYFPSLIFQRSVKFQQNYYSLPTPGNSAQWSIVSKFALLWFLDNTGLRVTSYTAILMFFYINQITNYLFISFS